MQYTLALLALAFAASEPDSAFPRFRGEEIDRSLKVGYGVVLVDLNADGKKDIVVADANRVIWFENPTWKMRVISQGQTKPDNVCIDAADIDGDGQLDLALGAEWKPFNTKSGGTLQWLKRGKTLDEPWTVHPISDDIPTIHRLRFADLDGDKKPELIVVPLMGRNSTAKANWMDGEPVEICVYTPPKDPTRDRWGRTRIDKGLHVVHNFVAWGEDKSVSILTASYDGVHSIGLRPRLFLNPRWERGLEALGNQDKPQGNRGASEIKVGLYSRPGLIAQPFIATIEPWHGHEVVVYTRLEKEENGSSWQREVIDNQLKWGHAVWCADLDDHSHWQDEIIIGVRDPLNDKVRSGVNVYKATPKDGKLSWTKHVIDNGGVAVEDLACADLNNDGRIDIVAVGRATRNVKIYWNEGKSK